MLEHPDRALASWGAVLRRDRARRLILGRSAVVAIGCAALGLTIVWPPMPRLVWNASASMPIGLYRVVPVASLKRGDLVIARPPLSVRALAAERHYLPRDVPLVKQVAAVAGQRLCWQGTVLTIDGQVAARRLASDRRGRVLPWWQGCLVLHDRAILLLAPEVADSFDGRYFGPTWRRDIVGEAVPLWLR